MRRVLAALPVVLALVVSFSIAGVDERSFVAWTGRQETEVDLDATTQSS